jgi:hypothetical protein
MMIQATIMRDSSNINGGIVVYLGDTMQINAGTPITASTNRNM